MNISLTQELDNWVNEKVQSGLYTSSSEVIREGLRLLIRQEEQKKALREELQDDLLIGIEQMDSGKSHVFDSNLLKRVKQNARKRKEG